MGAPNLFDPQWDFEGSREEGGAITRAVRLGAHAGARRLGATLYEFLVCSTNDLPEVAEQVETGLTVVLTDEYDWLYRDGLDIS